MPLKLFPCFTTDTLFITSLKISFKKTAHMCIFPLHWLSLPHTGFPEATFALFVEYLILYKETMVLLLSIS